MLAAENGMYHTTLRLKESEFPWLLDKYTITSEKSVLLQIARNLDLAIVSYKVEPANEKEEDRGGKKGSGSNGKGDGAVLTAQSSAILDGYLSGDEREPEEVGKEKSALTGGEEEDDSDILDFYQDMDRLHLITVSWHEESERDTLFIQSGMFGGLSKIEVCWY